MNAGALARRWQTWAIAPVVAFFGALAYYLILGLFAPEVPIAPKEQQLTMRGVIGLGRRGPELGWRFTAASTDVSGDGLVAKYHQGRATYYLKNKPAYTLAAPEVTLDTRTQNYFAHGGVHVWGIGDTPLKDLRTDSVSWNSAAQTLACPSPVRVRYKGMTFETSRADADLRSGELHLGKTAISGQ